MVHLTEGMPPFAGTEGHFGTSEIPTRNGVEQRAARVGQPGCLTERPLGRISDSFRIRESKRFRKRMHWDLVYGGGGCAVLGLAALFLGRSAANLAFGAFALAVGIAGLAWGIVGLVRLRSESDSN